MPRHRYPLAVHLLFRRGDEVLLSRRYQTGWHDGEYSVPAGHVEAGEPATAAAVREAREEVGVEIAPACLRLSLTMHRGTDLGPDGVRLADDERIDLFFTVTAWHGEPANVEPDKCDDLCWRKLDDLPPNTVPYIRAALHATHDGLTYCEFGWP